MRKFRDVGEIRRFIDGLDEGGLVRELERFQSGADGMDEAFMREKLLMYLVEEWRQQQVRTRRLTAADRDSVRAYRRLWSLFDDLGLASREEQDAFIARAREWGEKQRQRLRQRLTDLDVLAYLDAHPNLLEKILQRRQQDA